MFVVFKTKAFSIWSDIQIRIVCLNTPKSGPLQILQKRTIFAHEIEVDSSNFFMQKKKLYIF